MATTAQVLPVEAASGDAIGLEMPPSLAPIFSHSAFLQGQEALSNKNDVQDLHQRFDRMTIIQDQFMGTVRTDIRAFMATVSSDIAELKQRLGVQQSGEQPACAQVTDYIWTDRGISVIQTWPQEDLLALGHPKSGEHAVQSAVQFLEADGIWTKAVEDGLVMPKASAVFGVDASQAHSLNAVAVDMDSAAGHQAMKDAGASCEAWDCFVHAQAGSLETEGGDDAGTQGESNDLGQGSRHKMHQASNSSLPSNFGSASTVIGSYHVDLSQKNVHEVSATIWEAFIVMGTDVSHLDMQLQLTFALLCNIAMQSLFCVIIGVGFTRKDIDPRTSASLWRETVAHDAINMDMIRYSSLASRVCNNDLALHVGYVQTEFLLDIEQYAGDEGPFSYTGLVLCVMVLILYLLYVLPEAQDIVSFLKAICALPRTRKSCIEMDHSVGQFRVYSLSSFRFGLLLLLTFIRSIIACSLLGCGSVWLAREVNIENMILNAAALISILEVDELIFSAMAPLPIVILLRSLAPIERYSKDGTAEDFLWRMSSYQGIAAMGVMAAFVPPFMITIAWPQYDKMVRAKELMCGGNKDFVVGSNFQTQVIVATETNAFSEDGTKTYRQSAVRELIDLPRGLAPTAKLSAYVPAGTLFDIIRSQTMQEQSGQVRYCIDNPVLPAYLPQLRYYTRNDSATTCMDMQSQCAEFSQRLLRVLCPVSCGCASPRSGLLLDGSSEGCPRVLCRQSTTYKQVLDSYDCRDLNATELRALPGYRAFVTQWVAWGKIYGAVGDPNVSAGYDVVGQVLMGYGCQSLQLRRMGSIDMMSFCDETLSQSSMTAFCPVTCGCKSNPSVPSQCPAQCRQV